MLPVEQFEIVRCVRIAGRDAALGQRRRVHAPHRGQVARAAARPFLAQHRRWKHTDCIVSVARRGDVK